MISCIVGNVGSRLFEASDTFIYLSLGRSLILWEINSKLMECAFKFHSSRSLDQLSRSIFTTAWTPSAGSVSV